MTTLNTSTFYYSGLMDDILPGMIIPGMNDDNRGGKSKRKRISKRRSKASTERLPTSRNENSEENSLTRTRAPPTPTSLTLAPPERPAKIRREDLVPPPTSTGVNLLNSVSRDFLAICSGALPIHPLSCSLLDRLSLL